MCLRRETTTNECRNLPTNVIPSSIVVTCPHHSKPLRSCPAFHSPNESSAIAVFLDSICNQLARLKSIFVAIANPTNIGLANADARLVHLSSNVWETGGRPQTNFEAALLQFFPNFIKSLEVVRKLFRSFTITTTIPIIRQNPRCRNIHLAIFFSDGDHNLGVITVAIVMITVGVSKAQAIDWWHEGSAGDPSVTLQKRAEVSFCSDKVECIEAAFVVSKHSW
mmetsp:Transcript_98671/g.180953  ORF Transcript_98671/g.180953 Transcript_98671/m.180953 type:complete len:223 (-) Transcript_98671:179-847(-)